MKEILYLCSVFIKLVYRMDAKKILFIAQEITPYLPESEIATICRNLPQGIQERGREIRTFMPKFGSINERRNQLHEVIRLSGMNLIIDDTDHPLIIKVASIQAARMQVYFIDNEDFFQRKHTISDDDGNEYEDNDDRSIFYVRIGNSEKTPLDTGCHSLSWLDVSANSTVHQTYVCRRSLPQGCKDCILYL